MMAPRLPQISKKTLLLASGYVTFFVSCFLVFMYLSFPYDRARDLIVQRLERMLDAPGKPKPTLKIEELGPHWLTGIALEGVSYERKGATAAEPATKLALDSLTARASILGLISQRIDVHFTAEAGDGSIEGDYEGAEGEPLHVAAELDAFDLETIGLGTMMGLPLKGVATGTIDITLDPKPTATQGDIQLQIADVKLGDGKSKVPIPGMAGGLTLDTIDAGTIELKIAIRDGVATIEKLEAKGKDVELSGSGSIRVLKPSSSSRADITMAVKIMKSYMERSDRTKAMFGLLGSRMQHDADGAGSMRFKLTGPLTALHSAPAAGTGAGARSRSRGRTAPSAEAEE